MKNRKTHSMLLGLVGGYLLILAWQLFESGEDASMAPGLRVFFAALFALGGLFVLGWAWSEWRKSRTEGNGEREKEQEEDRTDCRKG